MHGYSHLLSGAAAGLQCASCLHINDVHEPVNLDVLLKEAVLFFDRIGEIPNRVSYAFTNDPKFRRASFKRFLKICTVEGHAVGREVQSVTITGLGFEGDAISDTWTPRSAITAAVHGKTIDVLVQSPREFQQERPLLIEVPFDLFGLGFSSAYVFPFPFVFSPLAYSSGLSYSSNIKRFGDTTGRDRSRVTNWSNHCYRGHRASEGYLRDVYQVNLVGAEHMEMPVGGVKLEDWIKQNPARGHLSSFHGKMLWELDSENIPCIQRELDRAKILLSGFPPH